MARLTQAKQRDFVNQFLSVVKNNADLLAKKGYDPSRKIEELSVGAEGSRQSQAKKLKALADKKDATKAAQQSLSDTYKKVSEMVDLVKGILGKEHALVLEIMKMRKVSGSSRGDGTVS